MYKQITETFEPTLTFSQKYMYADLSRYVNDKVMLERSNEIGSSLLAVGMYDLDKISKFILDFQRNYIHVDMCDKNVSKDYTVRVWARMNDVMIEVHK